METRDERYGDTDLPDEYLREIGRVVVTWNKLEQLITHTLVSALIEDFSAYERALAVFVHMAFPQKLDALGAMLQTIEEEFAILYRERVQGMLKEAQEKRNSLLHQYWYVQQGDVIRANIKARGILKVTDYAVSIQELREVSLHLDEAHTNLFTMITVPLSFKFKPQQGQ